jgi:sec-independent protein translocase protein TatC
MSLLNPKDKDLPIIEHLIELRDRLVISIISIVVAIFVCFFYVNEIWAFLVAPLNDALANTKNGTLATTDVFEGMLTQLKVAVLAGVVLASPMCFYQTWKYIFPALTITEAKIILPVSFASTVLFLLGVAFGYYVIFDYVFPFALELNGDDIQAVLSVNAYLITSTKLLLAFGLSFQLPIVTFVLARLGFVDHKDLFSFFRYAIVLILIISAILTPPDPLSQVLMAIPLIVLYVIGIAIAFVFSTKTREVEELPTETTPN